MKRKNLVGRDYSHTAVFPALIADTGNRDFHPIIVLCLEMDAARLERRPVVSAVKHLQSSIFLIGDTDMRLRRARFDI